MLNEVRHSGGQGGISVSHSSEGRGDPVLGDVIGAAETSTSRERQEDVLFKNWTNRYHKRFPKIA